MNLLDAPPPVVPALFVAFLAAGAGIGFYLARLALNAGSPDDMPPHRAAAVADARLALDTVSSNGSETEATTAIAQVLRRYLDERFCLQTQRMPAPDIERAMTRAGCARATGRLAAHLLERCDAARDGHLAREAQSVRDELRLAREIIDLTA